METKRKFITALSNMTMPKARKAISLTRTKRATIALLTAAAMLITPLGGMSGQFALDVRAAATIENMVFEPDAQEKTVYERVGGEVAFDFTVDAATDFAVLEDSGTYDVEDFFTLAYTDPGDTDNPVDAADLDDFITIKSITLTGDGGAGLEGVLTLEVEAGTSLSPENAAPAGAYNLTVTVYDEDPDTGTAIGDGDFTLTVTELVASVTFDSHEETVYEKVGASAVTFDFTVDASEAIAFEPFVSDDSDDSAVEYETIPKANISIDYEAAFYATNEAQLPDINELIEGASISIEYFDSTDTEPLEGTLTLVISDEVTYIAGGYALEVEVVDDPGGDDTLVGSGPITLEVTERSILVGTQTGTPVYGVESSVTFPVTTYGIASGSTYEVVLTEDGQPLTVQESGLTVSTTAPLVITSDADLQGTGILTIDYNGRGPAGRWTGPDVLGLNLTVASGDTISTTTGFNLTVSKAQPGLILDESGDADELAKLTRSIPADNENLQTFDLDDIDWSEILTHSNSEYATKLAAGDLTFSVLNYRKATGSYFDNTDDILAAEPDLTSAGVLTYTGTGETSGEATLDIMLTINNFADAPVTITFQATPAEPEGLDVEDMLDELLANVEVSYVDDYATLSIGDDLDLDQVGYGPRQDEGNAAIYEYGVPATFEASDELKLEIAAALNQHIDSVEINGEPAGAAYSTVGGVGIIAIEGADLDADLMVSITLEESALASSGPNAPDTFDIEFQEVTQVIVEVDGEMKGADGDDYESTKGNTTGAGTSTVPYVYTYTADPDDGYYSFKYTDLRDTIQTLEVGGKSLAESGTEVFMDPGELELIPVWGSFGSLHLNGAEVNLSGTPETYTLDLEEEGPGLYVFDLQPVRPIIVEPQRETLTYGELAVKGSGSDPDEYVSVTFPVTVEGLDYIDADGWYEATVVVADATPGNITDILGLSILAEDPEDPGNTPDTGKNVYLEETAPSSDIYEGFLVLEYNGKLDFDINEVNNGEFELKLAFVGDTSEASDVFTITFQRDGDLFVDTDEDGLYDPDEDNIFVVEVPTSEAETPSTVNLNDILAELAHEIIEKDNTWSAFGGFNLGSVSYILGDDFTDAVPVDEKILAGQPGQSGTNGNILTFIGTGKTTGDPATISVTLEFEKNFGDITVELQFTPMDDADITISRQEGKLQYGLPGTAADPDADVPVPANPNGTVTFTITANASSGISATGGVDNEGIYEVDIATIPTGVEIVDTTKMDDGKTYVKFAEADGKRTATLSLKYDGALGLNINTQAPNEVDNGFIRSLEIKDGAAVDVEGRIVIWVDRDDGLYVQEDRDGAPPNEILIPVLASELTEQEIPMSDYLPLLSHANETIAANPLTYAGNVTTSMSVAVDPDGVLARDGDDIPLAYVENGVLYYTGNGSIAEGDEATATLNFGFAKNFKNLQVNLRFVVEDDVTPGMEEDMEALEEWLAYYTLAEYEDKDEDVHESAYGPTQDTIKLDSYEYGFPAVINEDGTISVYFLDYSAGQSAAINGADFIRDVAGDVGEWETVPADGEPVTVLVDGHPVPVGGILTLSGDDLKELDGPAIVVLETSVETSASTPADREYETFELSFHAVALVRVLVNGGQEGVLGNNGIVDGIADTTQDGKHTWITEGGLNYNYVYTNLHDETAGKGANLAQTGADSLKKPDTLFLTPEMDYFQGMELNGEDVTEDPEWKPNTDKAGYGTYQFTVTDPGYYEFDIISLNPGVTVSGPAEAPFTYGDLNRSATYEITVQDIDPGKYEMTVEGLPGGTAEVNKSKSVVLNAIHSGEGSDPKTYVTIDAKGKGVLKLDIGEQVPAMVNYLELVLVDAPEEGVDQSARFELEIKQRYLDISVSPYYVAALEPGDGTVGLVYNSNETDPYSHNHLRNIFYRTVKVEDKDVPQYDDVRLLGNHGDVTGDDYDLPTTGQVRGAWWWEPNVIIDIPAGYDQDAWVFEYELTGADADNYTLYDQYGRQKGLHVDASVVLENIQVSPDRAVLRKVGDTAEFTISANVPHFDTSKVDWDFLGGAVGLPVVFEGSTTGETVTVKLESVPTDAMTVELAATYSNTGWISTATIQLIPETELKVTLLESAVTLNRAKEVGGILPMLISGVTPPEESGGGSIGGFGKMSDDELRKGENQDFFKEVALVTKGGSPVGIANRVPGYEAWVNNDLNIAIATTDVDSRVTTSRNQSGVEVFLLPPNEGYVPGGPEGTDNKDPIGTVWGGLKDHWTEAGSVNLRATTTYPRITIAQPSLDRFFNTTGADIRPTERSGADVTVEAAVSRHPDRVKADKYYNSDDSKYYGLVEFASANPAKGGSATVRLTLSVEGYKEQMLRKWNKGMNAGNQFDRSVKLSTAKPNLRLSPGNPTLKHQGKVGGDVEIAIEARNAWTTNQLGRVEKVEIRYNQAKFGAEKNGQIVGGGTLLRDEYDFYYFGGNRLEIPIPGHLGKEAGTYQVRIYFEGGAEVINQKLTIRNTNSPKVSADKTRITLNAHNNLLDPDKNQEPEWAHIKMRTNPLNLTDWENAEGAYTVEYKDGKDWKALTTLEYIGPDGVEVNGDDIYIYLDHTKTANLTARTLQLRISQIQHGKDTTDADQKAAAPDTRVRLTVTPAKPTVQLKTSGRISVINPASRTRLTVTLANTNDEIVDFQVGKFDGTSFVKDLDFQVDKEDWPTNNIFYVSMQEKQAVGEEVSSGQRKGYGHGYVTPGTYDLDWRAEMANGQILTSKDNARNTASGRVRVQPNQAAAKLARSKNAVTLYNQNPFGVDDINIRITQGAPGYDHLTFQGGTKDDDSNSYIRTTPNFGKRAVAGNDPDVQTGLSLTRMGANDWVFRMLNREALRDANGNLLTKNTTVKNVRLDAWPLGSYRLNEYGVADLDDSTGMPQPYTNTTNGKALTKPITISVNVNVRP